MQLFVPAGNAGGPEVWVFGGRGHPACFCGSYAELTIYS